MARGAHPEEQRIVWRESYNRDDLKVPTRRRATFRCPVCEKEVVIKHGEHGGVRAFCWSLAQHPSGGEVESEFVSVQIPTVDHGAADLRIIFNPVELRLMRERGATQAFENEMGKEKG